MKIAVKFLKILVVVTIVMVALIAGYVVLDMMVAAALVAVGKMINMPWLGEVDGFWLMLLIVLAAPKGWIWSRLGRNKPYVCHATMDIDAPVADVWDMYRLRPRDDYYASTMPTVRAVPGKSDEFELLLDQRLAGEGDLPETVLMKVDELIENFYIRMRCLNADSLPLFGKDLVCTEIWMEHTQAGQTRVTYAETLSRLTLVTMLAFLFLNPAKDGLKQVKARCEGSEDTSWMTKSIKDMGPNGEAGAETNQTMVMIMIATTAVLGLMTYGVIWLVLSMAT